MKAQNVIAILAAILLCQVATAQDEGGFPTQIKTRDGKVYHHTVKLRVEPDGIVVKFVPEGGGFGLAKLDFQQLSDSLRKQNGYDPKAAAKYEEQRAQAVKKWQAQLAANDWLARYRTVAELNRLLGGDSATSYSVTLDANGKVSATGTTGTPESLSITNVSIPAYLQVPYRHGNQTDYVPLPMPSTPILVK